MKVKTKGFWSTGRLVIGIIIIVLSFIVLFQSYATGLIYSVGANVEFLLAILTVLAGVIAICTRNTKSKVGPVIAAVLLLAGIAVGVFNAAVYGYLIEWTIVNIIFAIVLIICTIKTKKHGKSSKGKQKFICPHCDHKWEMKPDRDGLFDGYGNPPCPKCGTPAAWADDYGDFKCTNCGHKFRRYGNGGLHFGCIPSCPKCGGTCEMQ